MLKEIYYFREDKKVFSDNLKRLIKENNLTSVKVANKLSKDFDIDRSESLKKWKTGERLPSLDDLCKLSKILNKTMEELFLPNGVLKIKPNEYTDLYKCTDKEKYNILYRFSTYSLNDDEFKVVSSIEELKKQKDFKEEINYLLQKKLFSYLTYLEETKLKFYFENILRERSYAEDGKFPFKKVDYDMFWLSIDEDLKARFGSTYKYTMSYKDMFSEYFEFKKKLYFTYGETVQIWSIGDFVDKLETKEQMNEYFNQFDSVLINCIYNTPSIKLSAKEILETLGAKKLNISIEENYSVIDVYDEILELTYEEYINSLGGLK